MTPDLLDLALDELVDSCDGRYGDWPDVLDRAGITRSTYRPPQRPDHSPRRLRRRNIVLVAVVAVVAVLVATPAFGIGAALLHLFGRTDVSFSQSKPAPNVVKKQFADLVVGAPTRWAPQAIAREARMVGTFTINRHRRRLYVVPTRRGGYCYMFEESIGGCRQTRADRSLGGRGQLGVSFSSLPQRTSGWPVLTQLIGDLTAPKAARITIHYADKATADIPFVWVSRPIAAGFFSYDIPAAHRNLAARVVSVALLDRDRHVIGKQTFPRERVLPVPVRTRPPRTVTPLQRTLPTVPPEAPSQPIQRGTAGGFTVTVGHDGAVQFTQTADTPALQKLTGHSVNYSCFRLTHEFGIFGTRGLGQEARFAPRVGFELNGVGTPVDGCDIEGSAGHVWPDPTGGHSAAEIPLTAAGRAFFADRAAARELALFVRSKRVHAIRREPPSRAARGLNSDYRRSLERSGIRISTNGANLVFTTRSTTGKVFTVRVRNGRISQQNVRPYAFVF